MMVCPDCSGSISPALTCSVCGWQGQYQEGVPVLMSEAQLADTIRRSYTENYNQIATDDLQDKVMDVRLVKNLAANFSQRVKDLPGAEVCDVGVGKGFLARSLLARGAASVTAVDISLHYLARLTGQPGILPVMANAEALPFVDHFDIVVTTDVLEHVLNVGSFLYSVNRALRANGRFYVRVPYRENLLPYAPQLGCSYRFVHLRTYDRPLLRQALENAGFALERFCYDCYLPEAPRAVWNRSTLGRRIHKLFQNRLAIRGIKGADVTLLPHGLRQFLLRPIELVAMARKVKNLMPMGGGAFDPA